MTPKPMPQSSLYSFVFYPSPVDAHCVLTADSGYASVGAPYTDPAIGRPGQRCIVDTALVPNAQGARLDLAADGFMPLSLRGFLMLDAATQSARLQVDDYLLLEVPEPSPEPTPPEPDAPDWNDPLDVIRWVYATGDYDLITLSGCGRFTEDCCTALHDHSHVLWGHIRKEPGQNQWNGHAVDAIQILVNYEGASTGTYDIIKGSLAPGAEPAFNRVDDAHPDLWYYPAAEYPVPPQMQRVARQWVRAALLALKHPRA